jgi:hypothetical protein
MDKLLLLNEIFSCIRESRAYQNSLREVIIQVEQKIRWIKLSKRKLSQSPKLLKSKPKRKRVPYHSVYQLLNILKTKIKRPNFSSSSNFSPIEKSKLDHLFQTHRNDWVLISEKLQKSPLQCFQEVQRSKLKESLKKTWTSKEDLELCRVVDLIGTKNWAEVANYIDGKTGSSCMHRYTKILNPGISRGKWEAKEDAQLVLAVKLMGNNWVAASKIIGQRTDIQCRERYCNVLSPSINLSAWTFLEDVKIVVFSFLWGNRWSKIAKFFKGRTDNQCWRRSKFLIRTNKVIPRLALARAFGVELPEYLKRFVRDLRVFN